MKKSVITLCLAVWMTSHLMAGPIKQHTALEIGKKFMSTTVLGEQKTDLQLRLVSTSMTRGEVDYYVYNANDGQGFVVVAGDDRVKPILAYATTGTFDPENVAEGFAFTLKTYSEEIQYVRNHNLNATADIVAEWNSVAKTGQLRQGRNARAVVGPLCQTRWNQNYPWNSQCPEDPAGDGGYTYAGCAATAMAQVMKFFEFPARGSGSASYQPEGYPTQTANFAETDYHFELMPLTLDSTSTEEEVFHIAQLLHHCGISINMAYGPNGSGAYSEVIPTVLRMYFNYAADECEHNFWDPGAEWIAMMKAGGLDDNRPLYYSGSDDNGGGGHAFVCDGYDENDYFHFNWGWSGRDDAWCAMGALNTTKYAFNTMNCFIPNFYPQPENYYQRPDSVSSFGLTENGELNGVNLQWVNPSLTNNGNTLDELQSVTIRRNFTEIATLTDVQIGAAMNYEDHDLAPGFYRYSIVAANAAGHSQTVYQNIMVGEKCDVTFQLHDQGGDGWKGAAISVADEQGRRIAVIGMDEGSEKTVTLPLLRGNLHFIWNHGWYHSNEEYDTDDECAFSLLNADGDVIYTSNGLENGVFMTYDPCDTDGVEETTANPINIYPNPTQGLVNVEGDGPMHIGVYNVVGQLLLNHQAEDNTVLDLSQYDAGIYFIKIETPKCVTTQKINITH